MAETDPIRLAAQLRVAQQEAREWRNAAQQANALAREFQEQNTSLVRALETVAGHLDEALKLFQPPPAGSPPPSSVGNERVHNPATPVAVAGGITDFRPVGGNEEGI